MFVRSRSMPIAMAGLALAAILVSACAGSATPSGSPAPSSHPSPGASSPSGSPSTSSKPSSSGSAAASSSANASAPASAPASGASGSASPLSSPDCISALNLPHADPALEAILPCTIGNVNLERFSLKLSDYIASSSGGERDLYAPWLVQFGLTPSDVNMAVVADLTQQENLVIHAIGVPGAADDKLASEFADQGRKAGWSVASRTVAKRPLFEMVDPAAGAAGNASLGYVFASNHVLYAVITDDPSLLVEALIKLP
jgi:hypothetical protein